jgi:CDP-glucose 4,6-dehydratase
VTEGPTRPSAGPDPTFWRGARVFLTGHTGFKGSWLSLWLSRLGALVTGYALDPPTDPSLFVEAGIAKTLRSINGDLRDFDTLYRAIVDWRPRIVLHLAAQSVVKQGYADPIATYSTNVIGTVHLLEAIRRWGGSCVVVNVTSDKCYAPRDAGAGHREDDALGGHDPYSSSKACAELVTTAFRHAYFPSDRFPEHGVAVGSARAGNAIGGGDWTSDQLIPDLIRAFASGRPCPIRSPNAIRPWQHVLEPLRGYLLLAERLVERGSSFASPWNFGPAEEDARPVSWIADRLVEAWGGDAAWVRDPASHPPETRVLRLDATKAAGLGWWPALPLTEGLRGIVAWYKGWIQGEPAARLTLAQIESYEQLLAGPAFSVAAIPPVSGPS